MPVRRECLLRPAEEERPLPAPKAPPPPPEPQDDAALLQEFARRFGSAQRRQATERRNRYQALFQRHYG